jgi:FHA domain
VLESITHVSSKVIHVINMLKTDEAKIGRGHDADVRITDISVSRLHATVKKTNRGYFYIQDNKSKFGTLSLVRHPVMLSQIDPNYIQAGRTLLEFQLRMPISILSNCLCVGSFKKLPVAPKHSIK